MEGEHFHQVAAPGDCLAPTVEFHPSNFDDGAIGHVLPRNPFRVVKRESAGGNWNFHLHVQNLLRRLRSIHDQTNGARRLGLHPRARKQHHRSQNNSRHAYHSPRHSPHNSPCLFLSTIWRNARACCLKRKFTQKFFTPTSANKNCSTSVSSSMILLTGRPSLWPNFVSYISRIGLSPPCAACISAAIFRACSGATRVSLSPVRKSTAGYFVPRTTW